MYPSSAVASVLLALITLAVCGNQTEYRVVGKQANSSSVILHLKYTGNDSYYIKQKSVIIKSLVFEFRSLSFEDFSFKLYDPAKKRFEAYQGGIFPADPLQGHSYPLQLAQFDFTYQENPFTFEVRRRDDNTLLFSTATTPIIFSEYYLQIGTSTSSRLLYGLSERFTSHFRLQTGKWTMFPRDRGQMLDPGIGKQTHGYYPIYLSREAQGSFHLSYFRSSNALDVIIEDSGDDQYSLTYKVIGGIIDFRFFLGSQEPQNVHSRFQSYLGVSATPPFWSLGFHQSRWGYRSADQLQAVLDDFKENNIPIDTIWSDIDYMKGNETFTIDEQRFPLDKMAKIIQEYHYVPIIEPSIKFQSGYAWEEGKKRNLFIQDADGKDQIGRVWAGDVVFPDFFHPNATQYWNDMLEHLYSKVKFSGAWIDMNEISNLCNGPCYNPEKTGMDFTHDIPYHPGYDKIETQAIPLNATHHGDVLQANVHVYFGLMQAEATYKFLAKKGRPFIITRSNTLGSNKYSFHWTGDDYANFTFMRLSISSNFMFNFWGIRMVGSDICGFGGNVTEELCARWFQLGSLYPFARNHNEIQANDQEPYALGPRVLKSSQLNLRFRYSILKHYYREFILSQGRGIIFKPLFFRFPKDPTVYTDQIAETQFMIGDVLMSAPIVEEAATKRLVYFPSSVNWYNYHTGEYFLGGSMCEISNQIDDLVPIFIPESYMLFSQQTNNVTKSKDLKSEFRLVTALANTSFDSTENRQSFVASGGVLSIQDYENEPNIQECLQIGCDYKIEATLTLDTTSKQKQLKLEVWHLGSDRTVQEITVSSVLLYFNQTKVEKILSFPIKIAGPGIYTEQLGTGEHFKQQ